MTEYELQKLLKIADEIYSLVGESRGFNAGERMRMENAFHIVEKKIQAA
ncbi:MAG: hypothetical protein LBP62_03150 [Clostridiales bacterium]|jgi:hypothetical protein|nr:hypothetical protein [Clostridiales bacterium]